MHKIVEIFKFWNFNFPIIRLLDRFKLQIIYFIILQHNILYICSILNGNLYLFPLIHVTDTDQIAILDDARY